jgi:hypothetical protein
VYVITRYRYMNHSKVNSSFIGSNTLRMCTIRTIRGARFFSESKESELDKDGLDGSSGSPRSVISHEDILLLLNDEVIDDWYSER